MQQKPSVEAVAAPDGSLKRQAGRKPAEKAKLLVEYAQLPADKGGWKVGAGALCRSCPAVGGACPAAGGYAHPCIQLVNCVCAQFQAFQRPWRRSTQSPEMSLNTTYRRVVLENEPTVPAEVRAGTHHTAAVKKQTQLNGTTVFAKAWVASSGLPRLRARIRDRSSLHSGVVIGSS